MTPHIDPITLEVIRNALTAAAEEMSLVVTRAARSPLLREAGDHSSAITDEDGFLIAQGRDVPMHMGVMSFTVREFLKRVPKSKLNPGDVWFLNLPEVGGNHLPDVKAIRPIFVDGAVAAFSVSFAHWADTGGAVPGSYVAFATDAWQEGLRIPPSACLHRRWGRSRETRHYSRQCERRAGARRRHPGSDGGDPSCRRAIPSNRQRTRHEDSLACNGRDTRSRGTSNARGHPAGPRRCLLRRRLAGRRRRGWPADADPCRGDDCWRSRGCRFYQIR